MCIFSTCGQMVYGLLMIACVALTATSVFTDNWSETKEIIHGKHQPQGLMPWSCVTDVQGSNCNNWWHDSPTWLRATAVMMCIALAVEIIALAWNLVACFACCCKKFLIHPLTLFAVVITLFLAASVITYGANNKNVFKDNSYTSQLSWSFWLAVAALCLSAVDVVVGCLTVFLGRNNL